VTIHQLKMLNRIANNPMSYEDALKLNQITFGSICQQRWVDWNVWRKKFQISRLGTEVLTIESEWKITRLRSNGRLASRVERRVALQTGLKRGVSKVHPRRGAKA